MRVRDWQDILSDVVESDVEPEGWRAVVGARDRGIGEDMYLGHPNAGLYLLKTYAKNPFEVKGVGTRVARRIDDGIGPHLPDEAPARFAVRHPPGDEDEAESRARRVEETVRAHAEAPTTPEDLFSDVMEAVESPAFGPLEYDDRGRPEELSELATTFEDAEELLGAELDDLIEEDGVDRGFS